MRLFQLALLTFFLLMPSESLALGKLGHRLVCQLAYQQLSTDHQTQIDHLLAVLSPTEQKKLNQYNFQPTKAVITFAKSCTWPDAVKNDDAYKQYKPWHFINALRAQTSITDTQCLENCITHAIPFHLTQLKQATTPEKKLKALMFLGHWLGDIHQPLHVSFSDDRGGNKTKVKSPIGKCNNLHWYWDDCILMPLSGKKWQTHGDYTQYEAQLLTSLLNSITRQPIKHWQSSNVIEWANESLAIVREAKFNYCEIEHAACNKIHQQPINLTIDYHLHYQNVLTLRILQAAIRLANLLQQSLS